MINITDIIARLYILLRKKGIALTIPKTVPITPISAKIFFVFFFMFRIRKRFI